MRCPRCTHESKLALFAARCGAARELLDELLGSHGALSELAASILERTGGNSFFTEEVVQALVGAGNLVGELGEHASLIAHHWEASGMRFEASLWKRRAALKVANIKIGQRGRRPRS